MKPNQQNVHLHTSHLNMRRLLVLRGIAIGSWLITLLLVVFTLHIESEIWPLLTTLTAWAGLSLWTWWHIKRTETIVDSRFFIQLILDVAILTILLYLSGGSTNPFTLMFLLPLVVAASVLSMRYIWSIALLTISAYSFLLFNYIPFIPLEHHMEGHFSVHIIGMWWGFVISAALIATFAAKMGHTLRERDHILAEAKEKALRDEQLVALGSLAAGAAHELGTPLGTIAILANELKHEYADNGALSEQLQILCSQVQRCKGTLSTLSASAGQLQAAAGKSQPLDEYISDTIQQWQKIRPGISLLINLKGEQPPPHLLAEQTLTQALINIFNNAADASPDNIEIMASWCRDHLQLTVCDRGPGIDDDTSARIGRSIFTTKEGDQGMGLGLFLAYSVIHRLGGEIQLTNRNGGGVSTAITLPLQKLLV